MRVVLAQPVALNAGEEITFAAEPTDRNLKRLQVKINPDVERQQRRFNFEIAARF